MALPHELTRAVLLALRASSPLRDLCCAILACKDWSIIGLPILYEHVALVESNLRRFSLQLTVENARLVRSLSLRIPAVSAYSLPDWNWPATILDDMHGLQSLSLVLTRPFVQGDRAMEKMLDGSNLLELIQHIPVSCTSLELDTNQIFRQHVGGRGYHFCPAIARVLPQLRHLRLQLPFICAQIYGSAYDPNGTSVEKPEASTVLAPHLNSACFQCRYMNLCHKMGEPFTGRNRIDGSGSAHAILRASRAQMNADRLPNLQQLYIMTHVPQSLKNEDALIYPPTLKLDCVKQQITAMPCRQITTTGDYIHILGLPSDPDAVVSASEMDALAEGHLWRDLERPIGCRMCADNIRSSDHLVDKPLRYWRTRDEFWADNPKTWCMLWRNERNCGSRLLQPQVRQGLEDFSPVKQRIPQGWMAEIIHGPEDEGGTMLYDQLRPDDGESCRVLAGNDVRCDHGFTLDYKE